VKKMRVKNGIGETWARSGKKSSSICSIFI
jgi:hypothetical protein